MRCQGSACCGRHAEHAADACDAAHKVGAAAASVYCKPAGVHAALAERNSDRPPAVDVARRLRREEEAIAHLERRFERPRACGILSAMVDIGPGGLGGAYGLRGGREVPNTRFLLLSAALRGGNSLKSRFGKNGRSREITGPAGGGSKT